MTHPTTVRRTARGLQDAAAAIVASSAAHAREYPQQYARLLEHTHRALLRCIASMRHAYESLMVRPAARRTASARLAALWVTAAMVAKE